MHRGENFQPATWSGPPTWTKPHANGNQNGFVSGATEQSHQTTSQSKQPDLHQSAPSTGPGVWPSTSATTNVVGCVAGGSCPPTPWTRPSTSNPRSRMATARRPVIPPQLPPRAPQPSRPRQPSLVGPPVRTARQPCVHHDPLWPRHNIPTAYLPNPALETPPSRVTSVSSPLSVPSHSRSLGRPPFSLCPVRGTSIPRSPTRKSSRHSLPRSRRPRDYQHTAHGLKHRQHIAARWPQNWSHRQRTPSLGRRPTRHWHHFGVTFNSGQWTPQQSRPLCRSSSPGCQTCERAHVPRTPPNTTLQTCRASHRSWWPLEPGSHNLPTVAGPSKSPNHPSPAQGLIHECLDPPVVCPSHPCSNDRLCGQSPGIWLRCKHRHRRQPTSYQWGAGWSHPPPRRQPRPSPPLRSSGLDLALFPCTSGAAGI